MVKRHPLTALVVLALGPLGWAEPRTDGGARRRTGLAETRSPLADVNQPAALEG